MRHVLALNAGSSTLRFSLFAQHTTLTVLLAGVIDRIGSKGSTISITHAPTGPTGPVSLSAPDHVSALDDVLQGLRIQQQRLTHALRKRAATARAYLESLSGRRVFRKPFERLHDWERRLDEISSRSDRAIRKTTQAKGLVVASLAARLESLSPLSVLARGYSLTHRTRDGLLLRSSADVSPGEQIATRLSAGKIISRVEEIEP